MSEPKQRRGLKGSAGKGYQWGTERFLSVTTIIDQGLPKPNLLKWYAEMAGGDAYDHLDEFGKMTREKAIAWAAGAPVRNRDKAAVRGTKVHDYAEQFILGAALEIEKLPSAEEQAMARGFLKFMAEMKPKFLMTEATVISRKYGYAGTLDGIADFDGYGRLLIDYKGKPNEAKARWAYSNHVAQLNAYGAADFVALPDGSEEPMPKVDGGAVIYIYPENYTFIPCRINAEGLRFFRYLREVGTFTSGGYKDFLGEI